MWYANVFNLLFLPYRVLHQYGHQRNLAKDILAGPPPEFVAEPDGDTGDSCNTLDGGVDKRPSAAIEAALILQVHCVRS